MFIDKKKTEDHEILFSKIENDGFSLGLTRNKIEGSDLPYVSELIKNFIAGEEVDSFRINKDIILNQKFISLSIKDYTVFSYENGLSTSELFNISKGKLRSTKNIPGKFNFYMLLKK